MSAEDDLRKLIQLAHNAVAASHNGADFTAAYAEHSALANEIGQKCQERAYQDEYSAAVTRLLLDYRP
jgi:hypothetical protein